MRVLPLLKLKKAAGPTTLIEDAFIGANGTLLTAHPIAPTNVPGMTWAADSTSGQIQSNAYQSGGVATTNYGDSGAANLTILASLLALSPMLVLRMSDINNLWIAWFQSGKTEIYDRVAGAFTLRATATYSNPTLPVPITFSAAGNDLTATINGGNAATYNSSFNNTATKIGIRNADANRTLDTYTVTTP